MNTTIATAARPVIAKQRRYSLWCVLETNAYFRQGETMRCTEVVDVIEKWRYEQER